MDSQSILPGGLRQEGTTFLADIQRDSGGTNASMLGRLAATRYLNEIEEQNNRGSISSILKSKAQRAGAIATLTFTVIQDTLQVPKQQS